jgi:hypothetical protein
MTPATMTPATRKLQKPGTLFYKLANAKPTALFYAAQRGDTAAVQAALCQDTWSRDEYEHALKVAMRNGWHLVVQVLYVSVPYPWKRTLKAGEWNATLLTMLNHAGSDQTAETLIQMCGEVHTGTLLRHACLYGFIGTVKRLLNAKAHVNARDGMGSTALHYACRGALVNVLVRAKAHIDAVDDLGQTALHRAHSTLSASRGLVKIGRVKMLQRAEEWSTRAHAWAHTILQHAC